MKLDVEAIEKELTELVDRHEEINDEISMHEDEISELEDEQYEIGRRRTELEKLKGLSPVEARAYCVANDRYQKPLSEFLTTVKMERI